MINIIEFNRLSIEICKFPKHGEYYELPLELRYYSFIGELKWINYALIEHLKFDEDWNWIHYLISVINESPKTEMMNGIESIVPYININGEINLALLKNNKEQVVEALYKFLIWYYE